MVGPHAGEALLDAPHDVVAGEDVRAPLTSWRSGRSHQTTALARQIVLGASIADVAADPLLAHAIVDRRVDVVDAGVEHGVENGLSLLVGDVAAAGGPAKLHGPVAQHRDLKARPSECSFR